MVDLATTRIPRGALAIGALSWLPDTSDPRRQIRRRAACSPTRPFRAPAASIRTSPRARSNSRSFTTCSSRWSALDNQNATKTMLAASASASPDAKTYTFELRRGRQIPQRRRDDLGRRPGLDGALRQGQPERRQSGRRRPLRDARSLHVHHPPQRAERRSARRDEGAGLSVHDPARFAEGQAGARHRRDRHRAVPARRMGQGQPSRHQAVRRLFAGSRAPGPGRLRRPQDRLSRRRQLSLHAGGDDAHRRDADRRGAARRKHSVRASRARSRSIRSSPSARSFRSAAPISSSIRNTALTANRAIRQAIAAAIDIGEISEAVGGINKPNPWMSYPNTPYYPGDQTPAPWYDQKNPDKAKELLQKAGYKNEKLIIETNSNYQWMRTTMLVVAEQLKAAGMNVDVRIVDWTTNASHMQQGTGEWNLSTTLVRARAHPRPAAMAAADLRLLEHQGERRAGRRLTRRSSPSRIWTSGARSG